MRQLAREASVRLELLERPLELLELPLEQPPPELDRLALLLLVDEVADLVARPARGDEESQSREGVWFGAVRISTMSPLWSGVRSGTSLPLTRAPTQRWPTSVCTR